MLLGYFAALVAVLSLWGSVGALRRLFREAPPALAYTIPPLFFACGVVAWSLFSGMELALFVFLLVRAAEAVRRSVVRVRSYGGDDSDSRKDPPVTARRDSESKEPRLVEPPASARSAPNPTMPNRPDANSSEQAKNPDAEDGKKLILRARSTDTDNKQLLLLMGYPTC